MDLGSESDRAGNQQRGDGLPQTFEHSIDYALDLLNLDRVDLLHQVPVAAQTDSQTSHLPSLEISVGGGTTDGAAPSMHEGRQSPWGDSRPTSPDSSSPSPWEPSRPAPVSPADNQLPDWATKLPSSNPGDQIPTLPPINPGDQFPTLPPINPGDQFPTFPPTNPGDQIPTPPPARPGGDQTEPLPWSFPPKPGGQPAPTVPFPTSPSVPSDTTPDAPPKPFPFELPPAPGTNPGGDRLPPSPAPSPRPDVPARTIELSGLNNNSGRHNTPDAVVRLPQGFDPSQPIHLVIYDHGFGSNARSAYSFNNLDTQMENAPPNSVLVVPEWQSNAGSRSGAQGRFGQEGVFKGMLQEIFNKVPGLQGKTLDDVDQISILAHSAGYGPAKTELYNNGLSNKVVNLTLLDSLYDPTGFDSWISSNINDLAQGKKQFNNIFEDTSIASKQQAQRVQQMLDRVGAPASTMVQDFGHPTSITDSSTFAAHSVVFKYSNMSDSRGDGAHLSIPVLYFGAVEKAAAAKSGVSIPTVSPQTNWSFIPHK